MKKTLMLIDDHAMLINGLVGWIESHSDWKVVKTASTDDDCLSFLATCPQEELPAVIIFNLLLADELSFPLIKTVTEQFPQIRAVVYSMFDTTGYLLAARDAGACGYVSKASEEARLLECLEKVAGGGEFFEIKSEQRLKKADDVLPFLTKTEHKVFQLILLGKTNKQISEELSVGLHSVENYTYSIYEKLACPRNREELQARFN